MRKQSSKWIELFFPSPIRKLKQHSELMETGCDFIIASINSIQYHEFKDNAAIYKSIVKKLIAKSYDIRRQIRTILTPYHAMPILNYKTLQRIIHFQSKILDVAYKVVSITHAIAYAPLNNQLNKQLNKFAITCIAPCRVSNDLLLELMDTSMSAYVYGHKSRLEALLQLIEDRYEEADFLHTEIISSFYQQKAQIETMEYITWNDILSSIYELAHWAHETAYLMKESIEE